MAEHVSDTNRPGRPRRWFGRGRTRALLSAGLLLGVGAVGTSAFWTDRARAEGTSITAGALHIDLATNLRQRPETYAWSFPLTGLTPGATVARRLDVRNNSLGPARFTYRVRSSATGALGNALTVIVRRGGTDANCGDGVAVGSGALNGFDQPAGAILAPTQAHSLCVRVTLPAGSTVPASSSSAITFTFPATQVAP